MSTDKRTYHWELRVGVGGWSSGTRVHPQQWQTRKNKPVEVRVNNSEHTIEVNLEDLIRVRGNR